MLENGFKEIDGRHGLDDSSTHANIHPRKASNKKKENEN